MFCELCAFFAAGVNCSGRFEVWKSGTAFLRDRRRSFDTFSSAWEAWFFVHVAQTLGKRGSK